MDCYKINKVNRKSNLRNNREGLCVKGTLLLVVKTTGSKVLFLRVSNEPCVNEDKLSVGRLLTIRYLASFAYGECRDNEKLCFEYVGMAKVKRKNTCEIVVKLCQVRVKKGVKIATHTSIRRILGKTK